jgi:2-keto-4-pentenoate hydratase
MLEHREASTVPVPVPESDSEALGRLLGAAWARPGARIVVPAGLVPADNDGAYLAQLALLRRMGAGIGGWKVGAKSSDGPVQGAPLPLPCIHPNGATLRRADFAVLGIELEIMFRFGRDLAPGPAALTDAQVLDCVAAVGASVEIVASRLEGWPDVPKPLQLADLQNHGALVVGEMVGYDAGIDFLAPPARLAFNGQAIFDGAGSNPAGDPRRLLHWVVAQCRRQGMTLSAGTVITTGSYTGMVFPTAPGVVTGTIAGLPPIRFEIV